MEDEADAEGDEEGEGDDMDAEGENDNDEDQDNDDNENDNDEDEDQDDNDNDNDNDNAEQDEADSPSQSRRESRASPSIRATAPKVTLTSPSPRPSARHSPSAANTSLWPQMPAEALKAITYDIVPTMAAPQNTSINSLAATPDMRWVFSGGADGYIRMYNWVETANGKVPLTVAQKHPFVDSVMKAGSLTTYWENEESSVRTPPAQSADEAKDKDLSPVYSLAVHHQALWLLSGLESGGINLQTCRHQAGTRIATLREHTSAVSVLDLAQDELSFLSGSWDKVIHDWDLNVGKVKRSFRGSGGQISAIERRPESSIPVPVISEEQALSITFSSNNADKPTTNGVLPSVSGTSSTRRGSKNTADGTEDAAGSPDGSLFGDDSGSLFGDNDDAAKAGGDNNFDDDDEFSKAIANGIQQNEDEDAARNEDTEMTDATTTSGGPVQDVATAPENEESSTLDHQPDSTTQDATTITNGLPHSEDITAMSTTDGASDQPPQTSETTFLDAAIDGTLRIWDRRMETPIARIIPPRGTPPWCMAACWSPDGNNIYAGRRNQTVEEYSIHKGFQMAVPERTLRLPAESKAVSAVKMMPNGRHLVWYALNFSLLFSHLINDLLLLILAQCILRYPPPV